MRRWGEEGPPLDAYSRVTNAARFEPLHAFASELLDRLDAEFDVVRNEASGIDIELAQRRVVRPTVALTPRAENAAPLVVAFTDFPGLIVRFGNWFTRPFPVCGCDACDDTAEEEIERLSWMVVQLTEGRDPRSDRSFGVKQSEVEWQAWPRRHARKV